MDGIEVKQQFSLISVSNTDNSIDTKDSKKQSVINHRPFNTSTSLWSQSDQENSIKYCTMSDTTEVCIY